MIKTGLFPLPVLMLTLPLQLIAASDGAAAQTDWPQFRGQQASGIGYGNPPILWAEPKWKTPVPGLGLSCPVVWGDQLFITTAVPATEKHAATDLRIGLYGDIESVNDATPHSWQVLCLNKTDGRILWKQISHEGVPKIKRHPKSSHANPTPATDGKHVVCFFGAEGLFCYDLAGKLLWTKNFGALDSGYFAVPGAQWGFGSSPVIHGDLVVIQCDVQTNSFIAAFDVKTGRQVWRAARNDVPTWSTPTVARVEASPAAYQVIANGFRHIGGYDLYTGKEMWKLSNAGDIPVPTPIVGAGTSGKSLIFITSAHGKLAPIYAVLSGAVGDITLKTDQTTNAHIAWSTKRGGNYMQTPIVVGDLLYCGRDNGVVTCFTGGTGHQHYSERLGGGRSGFTASPVAAISPDGNSAKLFFTSEAGTVYVLKAGPQFEILATNQLGEACMATPAISGDALYFRTRGHVMSFAR